MAKKIEWTQSAIQDRFNIYHFWTANNNSDTFSKKLEILFNEAAKLISEFPDIGAETELRDGRDLQSPTHSKDESPS